jgi:hypothetical protein
MTVGRHEMAIGGLGTPEIIVIVVVVGGGLVLSICYLVTIGRTLAAVSEQHRRMNPRLVWLNLIPVFSLPWHFYTVFKVSESLIAEFSARGVPDEIMGDSPWGSQRAFLMWFVLFQVSVTGRFCPL